MKVDLRGATGTETAGPSETLTAPPGHLPGMTDAEGPDAVDPEAVRHVAALARVDLDEAAVDAFAEQFADILAYFETLDDVPAVDAEPDLVNVLRADEVREGLSQDEALANAPETEDGYFKGPPVG